MNKNYKIFFLLISFIYISCSNIPVNLSDAKRDIIIYYESGKYEEEIEKVIEAAKDYFKDISEEENSVVIFDVDETALSNYELNKKLDFGYIPELWDKWIDEAKSPAIDAVKNFYNFLLEKNIKIIFITGRPDYQYKSTYKNLVEKGYTKFDTLITRNSSQYKINAVDFKSERRKELVEKGYKIIGTVGDQWSDLKGEYHGYQVKIPNYIYAIE